MAICAGIQTGFEIVTKRSGKRALIPGGDSQPVQHPVLARGLRGLGERCCFAVDLRELGMGSGARRLGAVTRVDGAALLGIGAGEGVAGGLGLALRFGARLCGADALGVERGGIAQRARLAVDPRLVPLAAFDPRAGGGQRGIGNAHLGGLARLLGQGLGERDLGIARRALRLGQRGVQHGRARAAFGDPRLQCCLLGRKPRDPLGRVARQRRLACAIRIQPPARLRKFGDAPLHPVAGAAQRLQPVLGVAGGVAQPKRLGAEPADRFRGRHLRGFRLGLCRTALGDQRFGLGRILASALRRRRRIAPAREDHPSLGDADAIGKLAVALGLPRLALERGGTLLLLADQFVEAGEVGLGRAEFLLGVAAADMEAGDPRRFLQHRAALAGLGGDDRTDSPLADQSRRVRAGRGVGEGQRHVLGAHVAAIDAIGGSGTAFDAADDLQLVLLLGQIRDHRHFGEVALRPGRRTGEDHVFHAGAAHRLGAGLAHHPAQRFEQVGLAAAIGADDPRQPRFDPQIGRVDEALEARQPQPFYLHGASISGRRPSGAAAPGRPSRSRRPSGH